MYLIELRDAKTDRFKGFLGAGQTCANRGQARNFRSVGAADTAVNALIREDGKFAHRYTFTITES